MYRVSQKRLESRLTVQVHRHAPEFSDFLSCHHLFLYFSGHRLHPVAAGIVDSVVWVVAASVVQASLDTAKSDKTQTAEHLPLHFPRTFPPSGNLLEYARADDICNTLFAHADPDILLFTDTEIAVVVAHTTTLNLSLNQSCSSVDKETVVAETFFLDYPSFPYPFFASNLNHIPILYLALDFVFGLPEPLT